ALVGAGVVELLAREMTADLQRLRDEGRVAAKRAGETRRIDLETKGVRFGHLLVDPDGRIDPRGVEGVSHDLVVRPFGWNGHTAALRAMVEDELAIHHGIQSHHLATTADPARIG